MSVVIFYPCSDFTLTVENVSSVMALLKPERLRDMTDNPRYKIYIKDGDVQSTAFARYYVHSSLNPSWRHLAEQLTSDKDTPLLALERLRQFLPPIGIV